MADMKNQIFEQFLKNSRFSPPKGLVEEEVERLIEEAKEGLRKNKIKDEDIEARIKKLNEVFEKEAVKRVKLYFILDEIARRENINVDEKEISDMLNLLAQQSNTTLETVKKHYTDNNLIGYLRNQIKENKITEFLFGRVEIKEER
jgi:trigger factor